MHRDEIHTSHSRGACSGVKLSRQHKCVRISRRYQEERFADVMNVSATRVWCEKSAYFGDQVFGVRTERCDPGRALLQGVTAGWYCIGKAPQVGWISGNILQKHYHNIKCRDFRKLKRPPNILAMQRIWYCISRQLQANNSWYMRGRYQGRAHFYADCLMILVKEFLPTGSQSSCRVVLLSAPASRTPEWCWRIATPSSDSPRPSVYGSW